MIEREQAVELLRGLVAIPSLSTQEAAASAWLAAEMARLGYARAYVDAAGNAVGELGAADAGRLVVLLGHIDTVAGQIPVRIAPGAEGDVLYGRGAVDAKGPLATFVAAGARLGDAWARRHDVRVVVVGAVEEEYATSKGARAIAAAFDGVHDRVPDACIIGEPSSWQRVTLGYKGRLLVELSAQQPMAHTAGPDAGVATVAVDLWNWIAAYAARFNAERPKVFDQVGPSLRQMHTATNDEMHDTVRMQIGVRLPLEFDAQQFAREIAGVVAARISAPLVDVPRIEAARECRVHLWGTQTGAELRFQGYEAAWRSGRDSMLVRSFLAAIREVEPEARPSFVVKTGTSDMNVVGPLWGCPIVAYGPGDSSLDHTPHEHIVLDEYWRAVLSLERALGYLGGNRD